MKYRKFGNTGLDISAITMGTWAMGGGEWWGSDHDDKRYVDTLKFGFDNGINIIDTDMGYGADGHSEEIVGQALRGRRDKVYVVSKATADFLTAEKAEKTVQDSLKRMGTDYIDIYFIHWPDPEISVASNMEAMEKLRDKGLIKYIGVSNFTTRHMDIARTAGTIDVFQPPYSLFWRNIEKELLPYCIKNSIGVMTYSSLAMGLLSGTYTEELNLEEGDIRKTMVPLFQGETYMKALKAVEKIRIFAARHGVTVAQAAISWVCSQPGISTAITGATTPKQLEENIMAVDIEFSDEELVEMGKACEEVNRDVADWDSMYWKTAAQYEIKE
jgi:myo-inositol catabolism protein IolS